MKDFWEFPGGLVVRVWCFRYGLGSIPGQGLRSCKPRGKDQKKKKKREFFDQIKHGRMKR